MERQQIRNGDGFSTRMSMMVFDARMLMPQFQHQRVEFVKRWAYVVGQYRGSACSRIYQGYKHAIAANQCVQSSNNQLGDLRSRTKGIQLTCERGNLSLIAPSKSIHVPLFRVLRVFPKRIT